MNNDKFKKLIQDNNELIAFENKKIEGFNKKISESPNEEKKQFYYEKIKESQILICDLETENEESAYEIKKVKIHDMKDYLDKLKNAGEIDEHEYNTKYTGLRLYSKIEELTHSIKFLQIGSKKDIIISTKSNFRREKQKKFEESAEQQKVELDVKQQQLEKNIKKLKKIYLEDQFKTGKITNEEYRESQNILVTKHFSVADVDELATDIESVIGYTENLVHETTPNKLENNTEKDNSEKNIPKIEEKIDISHFTYEQVVAGKFFKNKKFRDFNPDDLKKLKADYELRKSVAEKERREKEKMRDKPGRKGLR